MLAEVEAAAERLARAFPPCVSEALSEDGVEDVSAADDGCVYAFRGERWSKIGEQDARGRYRVLNVASAPPFRVEGISSVNPNLEVVVPWRGGGGDWGRIRLTGMMRPIATTAQWNVRKPQPRALPLSAFDMTGAIMDALGERIGAHSVAFFGAVGSGKTSLMSSAINSGPFHDQRIVLIEDVAEVLLPNLGISLSWLTAPWLRQPLDLSALIVRALRAKAQSIVVGEVRGSETDALMHAATAVRPVMFTVHAQGERAETAVRRLADQSGGSQLRVLHSVDTFVGVKSVGGRRVVFGVWDSDPDGERVKKVA